MPGFVPPLAREPRGTAAIEYGLIAGLIVLAIVIGAGAIGSELGPLVWQLSSSLAF